MPTYPNAESTRPTLRMPPSGGIGDPVDVGDAQSAVIVGANGSGKSRLGSWIEQTGTPQTIPTHRVAAQRSIEFADKLTMLPLNRAESMLRTGYPDRFSDGVIDEQLIRHYRTNNKYNSKPTTRLISDFDATLQFLFAEVANVSKQFLDKHLAGNEANPPVPDINRLQELWHSVFPYRLLEVSADSVHAVTLKGIKYPASEMSDGERAAFYLIGQCLSAPQNAIVIVDEPELHLHRSIQARLWDGIERLRPDCYFVYLTHDIEFAASRSTAAKITITDFDGKAWTWERVEQVELIPEEILLRISGSRKSILFVEGSHDSLDQDVYRLVYDRRYIVPLGGCQSVIDATKGIRASDMYHRLDARGIVDRDRLTQDAITALSDQGIEATSVSESENLLLLEPLVTAVADHLGADPLRAVEQVKKLVFTLLREQRDQIATEIAHAQVRAAMHTALGKPRTADELETNFSGHVATIDVRRLVAQAEARIDNAVNNQKYAEALGILNNKGAIASVAQSLDVTLKRYRIVALARLAEDANGALAAIRAQLPSIP